MQADAQEVAPPVNLKERRPSVADRNIENASTEVPEIPDELERVLVFALDEAKEKIEGGEDVIPFTTLVVKDNLFIESHPGDSAEECFEAAEKNVRGARGADCYAFCYDGYIETDDGVKDALIAEGGVPGADEGYAIAYLYVVDDEGAYTFESEAAYIGEAPNFMATLKEPVAYTDDEIDERYRDDTEEAVEDAEAAEAAEEAAEAEEETAEVAEAVVEEIEEEAE